MEQPSPISIISAEISTKSGSDLTNSLKSDSDITNALTDPVCESTAIGSVVWGKLDGSMYYKSAELCEDIFTFGRSREHNKCITKQLPKEDLDCLSRVQFRIENTGKGAILFDDSKEGTYVNEILVGQFKSCKLKHGSKIAVLYPDITAFTFYYEPKNGKENANEENEVTRCRPASKVKVPPKSKPLKENNPNDLNFTLENRFQLPESASINKPVFKNDRFAKTKINNKTTENKPRERTKRSQSSRRVDKSTSPVQAKRVTRSTSVKTPKARKSLNSDLSKGKGKKKKK